jgi:hypothetical protein
MSSSDDALYVCFSVMSNHKDYGPIFSAPLLVRLQLRVSPGRRNTT